MRRRTQAQAQKEAEASEQEKPVAAPKERKRVGMSLADYAAKYN